MAKITLIGKNIEKTILPWAEGLRASGQKVGILTSHKQDVSKNPNQHQNFATSSIIIQSFFKNWTLLETLRLSPYLLQDLPEIFHFVFTDRQEVPNQAHWGLLSLAQSLHRKSFVSFSSAPPSNWAWRRFIKLNQGCSFESTESLIRARQSGLIERQQYTEILSPIRILKYSQHQQSHNIDIDPFIKSMSGLSAILIAGAPQIQILQLLKQSHLEWHPIFWSEQETRYRELNARMNHSAFSKKDPLVLDSLLKNCKAIALCFHNYDNSELLYWQELSQRFMIPLWVRNDQMQALPGLCQPGKTGLIVTQMQVPQPQANTQWDFSESLMTHSSGTDATINSLNRIYSKIIESKTN